MKRSIIYCGLFLGGLSAASLAQAQSQAASSSPATVRIQIGATPIDVPLPKGFCLAEDEAEKAAEQLMAASDSQNVTHLIASECGKSPDPAAKAEYFMLKTPRDMLAASSDRQPTLAAFKEVFDSGAIDLDSAIKEANTDLNKTMPTEVKMDGAVSYRGHDDSCVYLAGVADVSAAELSVAYKVGMAGCLTTVHKKMLSVNWYSYDPSSASINRIKEKTKALVVAMSAGKPQ